MSEGGTVAAPCSDDFQASIHGDTNKVTISSEAALSDAEMM